MGSVLGTFQLVENESKKQGKYYVLNEVFVGKNDKPRMFLVLEIIPVKHEKPNSEAVK